MSIRSVCPDEIPEKTSYLYAAVLKKETDAVIPASEITTLTLTLYALDSALTIINSVNAVNILNTGRGTVDAFGNLAIALTPADNQVLDTTLLVERHIMLIQATYNSGNSATRHEVLLTIRNLAKVA